VPPLDTERAPVVFAWLAYRQDAFAGELHLQTLYRLDRVGAAGPQHAAALQPSIYFGQSVAMLHALIRTQRHALLPQPAPGCHWRGPLLFTEVPVLGTGPACHQPAPSNEASLPTDPRARLRFAQALAHRVLQQRERT
jgi:hypothetical protein